MPLLTPLQQINASLAEDARTAAAHLNAAANVANRMVARMLQLDDAQLAEWLNAMQDPTPLFAAHGQLGSALNAAMEVAAAVLSESGLPSNMTPVDVRSVPEKLADQYRAIELTEQGWQVNQLPQPEPEPEPSPENP